MALLRNKKFLISLIAVIFLIIVSFSVISVFSLQNIDFQCTVSATQEGYAVETKQKLNKYLNKSLVLLNESNLIKEVEANPYFKVESVSKIFPNTLKIKVVERAECYYIEHNSTYFVLDKNGFCLNQVTSDYVNSSRLIKLSLVNIGVQNITVGKVIAVDKQNELLTAFEMSKLANLGDSIKTLTLYGISEYAVFETHTGVRIDISKYQQNDGLTLINVAFNEYHAASDFVRTFNRIIAYVNSEGVIQIVWSETLTDYQ